MSRTRSAIRETVACPSCGAAAGSHCVAYVQKKGKTTGKPTFDVHAARWRAWRRYLSEDAAKRYLAGATDTETVRQAIPVLVKPLLERSLLGMPVQRCEDLTGVPVDLRGT